MEQSGQDGVYDFKHQEAGAILYRTTSYFLERLGLAGLEELPDLAPFLPDQVEDAAESIGEAVESVRGAVDPVGKATGSGDEAGSGDEQGA